MNKLKIATVVVILSSVLGLYSCASNNIANGGQACTITLQDARGVVLQTWSGDITMRSNVGDAATTFELDGKTITIRGGIVVIER